MLEIKTIEVATVILDIVGAAYLAVGHDGVTVQFVLIVAVLILNNSNDLQGSKSISSIKTNTFCYFLKSRLKTLKFGSEGGHRRLCFASEFKITRSE